MFTQSRWLEHIVSAFASKCISSTRRSASCDKVAIGKARQPEAAEGVIRSMSAPPAASSTGDVTMMMIDNGQAGRAGQKPHSTFLPRAYSIPMPEGIPEKV